MVVKLQVFDKHSLRILLIICQMALTEADPYFTVKLHDKTGVEKDEIILKCEVSKDVPVKWFKDGEEIVPSLKHSIKSEGLRRILKIKKAEFSDKGEYVCDCGTDKTNANVNVEGESLETFKLTLFEPSGYLFSRSNKTSHNFSSTNQSGKTSLWSRIVCWRNSSL